MPKKVMHQHRHQTPMNRTAHALMVGSGVVLFWRGAWGLLDHFLLPSHPMLSFVVSLLAGFVILHASHMLVRALD